MKFKYSILYVQSVAATLSFYEAAFGFKPRFLHEAGDYGELDTGDTVLAFSSLALMTDLGKNPAKADSSRPVFELAFETTEVKRWLDQSLSAGAKLVQDVEEKPWGQSTAYVSDMNGFLIEICSPVAQ